MVDNARRASDAANVMHDQDDYRGFQPSRKTNRTPMVIVLENRDSAHRTLQICDCRRLR